MSQPPFKRARTPEAKATRRTAILLATATVLARDGLEHTTLNAIAAEAGVVKSNIYRYFESREEILMRLLTEDMHKALAAMGEHLSAPRPISEVAIILGKGLSANPRLCLLISITALTLERNISANTLREIKREMIASLASTAKTLRQGLPALNQEQAEETVHLIFSLVAGLWPFSNPGAAMKTLYAEPEFSRLSKDFEQVLTRSIETMLKGMLA